jgi:hypothetical protein
MEEADAAGEPVPRRLVEQRDPAPLERAERVGDVGSLEAEVMEAFAAPARKRATPESARVGSSSSTSLSPAASRAARTPWSAISASRSSGNPSRSRQNT